MNTVHSDQRGVVSLVAWKKKSLERDPFKNFFKIFTYVIFQDHGQHTVENTKHIRIHSITRKNQ